MYTFDRQVVLADVTTRLGMKLTPQRTSGLGYLLDRLEADPALVMIRQAAYVLATIRWETGATFQPIAEQRAVPSDTQKYNLQNRYWATGFYGRGYVQITWEDNYRLAGARLAGQTFILDGSPVTVAAETFVQHPDYIMHPEVAYQVCSRGMKEGWFTGKKLDDYIKQGTPPDYVNARRIVNGQDHAQDIANYATQFELLLRAATPIPSVPIALVGTQPNPTPVAPPIVAV
jgi:putative chitinase